MVQRLDEKWGGVGEVDVLLNELRQSLPVVEVGRHGRLVDGAAGVLVNNLSVDLAELVDVIMHDEVLRGESDLQVVLRRRADRELQRLQGLLMSTTARSFFNTSFAAWLKDALEDFIHKFSFANSKVKDLTARLHSMRRLRKGRASASASATRLAGSMGTISFAR